MRFVSSAQAFAARHSLHGQITTLSQQSQYIEAIRTQLHAISADAETRVTRSGWAALALGTVAAGEVITQDYAAAVAAGSLALTAFGYGSALHHEARRCDELLDRPPQQSQQ